MYEYYYYSFTIWTQSVVSKNTTKVSELLIDLQNMNVDNKANN